MDLGDSIDDSWTPETSEACDKRHELEQVEDLADKIQIDPSDEQAKKELRALLPARSKANDVGRKRHLERAAKHVIGGGDRSDSQIRNRLALAAARALLELAKELQRPPAKWEVVARMRRFKDGNGKFITSGDDKELRHEIDKIGFPWLESRKQGYQGER